MNTLLSKVLEEQTIKVLDGISQGQYLVNNEYSYLFRCSKYYRACMDLNYEDFNLKDKFEFGIFCDILYHLYLYNKISYEKLPLGLDVRIPVNYYLMNRYNPNREFNKVESNINQILI